LRIHPSRQPIQAPFPEIRLTLAITRPQRAVDIEVTHWWRLW